MKPIQVIIGILILILLQNCSYRTQIKKQANWRNECNNLFKTVDQYWEYKPRDSIYGYTEELEYGFVKYEDCLIGVKKKALVKFLGEPTKEDGKILKYFMSPYCYNPYKDCVFLRIKLSENQRIEKFKYLIFSPGKHNKIGK